jgi:precorrin-6A/cobalt-precorrin-6A reductase
MILLMGGTSDSVTLARELAAAGCRVLVSTATDIPLPLDRHPHITRRMGPLDEAAMAALVRKQNILAIVDAAHPYAAVAHATAKRVADSLNIPCLILIRPTGIPDDGDVAFAADHEEAARIAFAYGCAVLLTTGAKNLAPYVREARSAGVPLIVRVLPEEGSRAACRAAGVQEECIITGRGPFTVAENCSAIRLFGIGVLVAKDSGPAGGTPEKIEAARREGCRTVIVRRPARPLAHTFVNPAELVKALLGMLSPIKT